MRMRASRGLVAALAGIAITIFAWFSPWAWPGWPALVGLRLLGGFLEPESGVRAAVATLLIAANVGVWAVVVRLALHLLERDRE